MPDLYLKKVPEDLYRSIEQLAAADRVELADEAIRLLQEAVGRKPIANGGLPAQFSNRTQQEVLDDIIRHRFNPKAGMPGVVELLREDRER